MGHTFDYISAALSCPICHSVSKDDGSINMQTKICKNPSMKIYRVGDYLELDSSIEESGYYCVNKPQSEKSFSILESWECPACGTPFNWAFVKVEGSVISLISEVELSELISSVNFVSEDCVYSGWRIVDGVPSFGADLP